MLTLVADTNVFIHQLATLRDIVANFDSNQVSIAVPAAVVQELDGLKRSSDRVLSSSAHEANATLWTWLRDSRLIHRVIGQQVYQYIQAGDALDDKILDYCLWLAVHDTSGTTVTLFTADKNLSVKAAINRIHVLRPGDFLTQMTLLDSDIEMEHLHSPISPAEDVEMHDAAPETEHTFIPQASPSGLFDFLKSDRIDRSTNSSIHAPSTMIASPKVDLTNVIPTLRTDCSSTDLARVMDGIFLLLIQTLPPAIDTQLDKCFGGYLYPYLITQKRPWTLSNMFRIIGDKWSAAFKELFIDSSFKSRDNKCFISQELSRLERNLNMWQALGGGFDRNSELPFPTSINSHEHPEITEDSTLCLFNTVKCLDVTETQLPGIASRLLTATNVYQLVQDSEIVMLIAQRSERAESRIERQRQMISMRQFLTLRS